MPATTTSPRSQPTLGQWDAVAMIVGIVVGIGIFRFPSFVAGSVDSGAVFLLLWLAGGAVSLVGALVYAELASAFPSSGGEYHFLTRAYGPPVGFLFAWARMAVIQTGSIAIVGFVFGDYASQILPLGAYGPSIYAAAAIALLTVLNVFGATQGKWTQNVLAVLIVTAIAAAVAAGLAFAPAAPEAAAAPPPDTGSWAERALGLARAVGAAMIFVLLTYGGWNESAYLSGEMRDVRRTMLRALLIGIGIITATYLVINYAYLRVLGLDGVRGSQAVGADLLRMTVGEAGAIVLSLIVCTAALSTLNGTIFTGARTTFALGRDFPLFGYLGRWKTEGRTPANALMVQGAVALALVVFATFGERSGVERMVDFSAPVFWVFFLLAGLSLFVLRWREPDAPRPFRVPLYPVTPMLFAAACLFMLYSSVDYARSGEILGVSGALVGVAVVAAGVPLLFFARGRRGA